jgi:GNAT superfamily N-acetyltransferase
MSEPRISIRVSAVSGRADMRAFLRFPRQVYRDDPNWVAPLDLDVREKLNVRKHPFFAHAERELFLARRDGLVVGRIAAILDRNHNSFHGESVVFFGLYECLDDLEAAGSLLDAAAAWGRERGMTILRGPVNLSLNDECAFLAEGFDSPPVVMMPYNPRYYLDQMERCGLVKARDLYAFLITPETALSPKIVQLADRIRSETKVVLRSIDLKNWKIEARAVQAIYNGAWEKNWGFVPWTQDEMNHTVKAMKMLADPDFVVFAEIDGRPVGFGFALPNYNEILIGLRGRLFPFGIVRLLRGKKKIRTMRMLVFGVLREVQGTGLAQLLAIEIARRARARGFKWCELSWQLEDNVPVNRFVESIGGRQYKTYRIYERRAG